MAASLMIQGTMSNAGKSLICAGLCRIFHQDGLRVAPFKAQNMALNSFITKEGLEMGRAQVVQAEAAGVEPSVLMNPILLKPTTDMGSQVIVNGRPLGNYRAMDYYRHKSDFIPYVRNAYERLATENDLIIIEGAGSPAEINLRENDFVNMGMAKIADAPVLLVGDIDRGGVFAQLYGTIALLEPDEQARIKGVIINKFRGDKTILDPGLDLLYEKIHRPCLGVVPYADVHLEEEDSLAASLDEYEKGQGLDIAVIRLPRISNFTDFQVFTMENGVSVRYCRSVAELGSPDLIILPGTKSTIADLKWLRESGLEARIKRLNAGGTPVIGICGGFQMMGENITDPDGAEADPGTTIAGIGLLPLETVFSKQKTMKEVKGPVSDYLYGLLPVGLHRGSRDLSRISVKGYEIHMGKTRFTSSASTHSFTGTRSSADTGAKILSISGKQGMVLGTYVHGIFDEPDFRGILLDTLAEKKGVRRSERPSVTYDEYKEQQYDKLADLLRENLDMKAIYRIAGLTAKS